jgi:transcription antitermination factor NusG
MVEENEIWWYAVGCVSSMKELKVRDDIRNYGLEAFVPLKYHIKTIKHQKHRALVPAMPGLMFAKGTLDELQEYIQNHAHFPVYLRKSTFSNKEDYLTVRDKDMEAFIAATENNEAHITYFRPDEINLQAGDKIRVKGGIYDGKEGIVMRIKGKRNKHLVVQIPGMLVAAIEMEPELVELQQDAVTEEPSRDVEGDKKLLYEYSYRLLFEINGRYKENAEYFLLLSEVKRAKARLEKFKGFTATTEAELALPMFMADKVLGISAEESEARLRKAIAKLKDSSKLKEKCGEIMQKCNNLKM